jgi:hypothetical protein
METAKLLLSAQAESHNNLLGDSVLNSNYFNPDYLFGSIFGSLQHFFAYLFSSDGAGIIKTILVALSLFFMTIICYVAVRMLEIRKKEHAHLHHEIHLHAQKKAEKAKETQEKEEVSKNPRWVQTLEYLFSANSGDWKLAVIEADSMLETLLDQLGFKGETLGDKLKGADPDKFRSLTTAWEVHTIRNRIAHEGLAFELSQREAKRVVALYEQIFRQFGFI